MTPVLAEALRYAEAGWYVHPVNPETKVPLIKQWEERSSTDPKQIAQWWETFPQAGVGINCGKSSIYVVDVDVPMGTEMSFPALCDAHGTGWIDTVTQDTPSGGQHYVFQMPRVPVQNFAGTKPGSVPPVPGPMGFGIDGRGDGGQIVVAPTKSTKGEYAWLINRSPFEAKPAPMPKWLIDGIVKRVYAPPQYLSTSHSLATAIVERALRASDGGRNNAGFWAACQLRDNGYNRQDTMRFLTEGFLPYVPATNGKGQKDRYSHEELEATVGSVYVMAARKGWDAPNGTTPAARGTERPTPKMPTIIWANDLQRMDIAEPRWAVAGLLPQGLALLAGKPKAGKSFMALCIAIAVASGGTALGKVGVDAGIVLYLALEDSDRRLKNRMAQMMGDDVFPSKLATVTEWPRMDAGGAELLDEWIGNHPGTRLVIIDTLAKVRPQRGRAGNVYDEDYEAAAMIKGVADKHEICILVLHHLRKMTGDDPLDMISGTLALPGAADAILILLRTGTAADIDAKLHVTGRDMESSDLAMRFWRERTTWEIAGDWDEESMVGHKKQIYAALAGGTMNLKDLQAETDIDYEVLRKTVGRLTVAGDLQRAGRGQYSLPKAAKPAWNERKEKPHTSPNQGGMGTRMGTDPEGVFPNSAESETEVPNVKPWTNVPIVPESESEGATDNENTFSQPGQPGHSPSACGRACEETHNTPECAEADWWTDAEGNPWHCGRCYPDPETEEVEV